MEKSTCQIRKTTISSTLFIKYKFLSKKSHEITPTVSKSFETAGSMNCKFDTR